MKQKKKFSTVLCTGFMQPLFYGKLETWVRVPEHIIQLFLLNYSYFGHVWVTFYTTKQTQPYKIDHLLAPLKIIKPFRFFLIT